MPPGPGEDAFAPGGFGVRRPLRFLAYKLDLDENQVVQLARIMDELKTERAQAAVDTRRALADVADALGSEMFDAPKIAAASAKRAEGQQRVSAALARALEQIHALLKPEQRVRLSHLIRTGVLAF